MLNLAGKYANVISRNPITSAMAGGLGTAGLATLGNVVSGEAQDEGPGRLGLEALGAGALGTALGAKVPGLRGRAAQMMRDVGAVSLQNPGAAARREKMSPSRLRQAEFARDILNTAVRQGADPATLRNDLKESARRSQALINTAAIPIGLTMAGGAGGMVGGGVGNVGQLLGIPGLQQNTAMQGIDPESYTSSNMPGARQSISTLQY